MDNITAADEPHTIRLHNLKVFLKAADQSGIQVRVLNVTEDTANMALELRDSKSHTVKAALDTGRDSDLRSFWQLRNEDGGDCIGNPFPVTSIEETAWHLRLLWAALFPVERVKIA